MREAFAHFSDKNNGVFQILTFEILTKHLLTTSLVLNNRALKNSSSTQTDTRKQYNATPYL